MQKTIGNPLTWMFKNLGSTGSHAADTIEHLGSEEVRTVPQVRKLTFDDIRHALKAGSSDFMACRSDAMFIVFCYPLIGLLLVSVGASLNLIPLIMPVIFGFAIVGPVAAVGLYEMSSRREAGFEPRWMDALAVIGSPAFGAIVVLGFYLAGLFIVWLIVANMIYSYTLGPEPPASLAAFASATLTTGPGWVMTIVGTSVGGLFALAALATSLVSFPLLLDRHVGVPMAVATSFRVFRASPVVCLSWGFLVGSSLIIGALPFLLGLIIVMPILGHATWHLYRRAVV